MRAAHLEKSIWKVFNVAWMPAGVYPRTERWPDPGAGMTPELWAPPYSTDTSSFIL